MDTKWVVGAAVAAFVGFGGLTWWMTSEPAAASSSPTAQVTKAKSGKQDAKSRKSGAHGKARKGGKSKGGKGAKGAKGGKGKAKARPSGGAPGARPTPEEAAARWDAFRDVIADGGHARVAEYGAANQWDDAKVASTQKLLDDGIARLDGIAAQLASGELTPEAARTEIEAGRRDMQASLYALLGESEAKALLATMKPPRQGSARGEP